MAATTAPNLSTSTLYRLCFLYNSNKTAILKKHTIFLQLIMSNHHLRLTICHRYMISFTFLLFNNTLKDQTFLIHLIRDCRNRSPVPPSNIYTLVEQCIKDGLVLLIAQVRDAVSLCEPSLHLSTGALIPIHSNMTTSH